MLSLTDFECTYRRCNLDKSNIRVGPNTLLHHCSLNETLLCGDLENLPMHDVEGGEYDFSKCTLSFAYYEDVSVSQMPTFVWFERQAQLLDVCFVFLDDRFLVTGYPPNSDVEMKGWIMYADCAHGEDWRATNVPADVLELLDLVREDIYKHIQTKKASMCLGRTSRASDNPP